MTPAERRALLGDDVIAAIRKRVAQAPPPSAEVVAELRPILTSRPVRRPSRAVDRPAA